MDLYLVYVFIRFFINSVNLLSRRGSVFLFDGTLSGRNYYILWKVGLL